MSEIQIIENFLPEEIYQEMYKNLLPVSPPNFWELTNVNQYGDNNYQFTYPIFTHYNIRDKWLFSAFANELGNKYGKVFSFIRLKMNLITKTHNTEFHGWHTDFEVKSKCFKTAIWYLNTTNGQTHFKDGTKIDCIANRMVIFPTQLEHSSTSQTDEYARIVVNIGWVESEES